jgi:hypothetical protein
MLRYVMLRYVIVVWGDLQLGLYATAYACVRSLVN